ncbi:GIY-YIG nuclease family protein [Stenotrophomonas maltophilia]
MNWKRNQKYLPRPRHLYGLFFDNGCCYVGQTVDLKQREQQHRSARGGWQGRRFSFVPLSSMTGTQADAEAHEYAWRYKAFQHGWRIYSKPPGILIREPKAFWVTNEEAPMQVEPLRSEVELSGLSILRKQPPKHFSSHLSWIHILSSKAFDKRKLFT